MPEALQPSPESIYAHLATVSLPVAQRYLEVLAVMQDALPAPELVRWGQSCLQLAQCGWRTWESAETFVSLSPFLVRHIPETTLWEWAEYGTALAQRSSDVATAFFQAAKPFLQAAAADMFTAWVTSGQWYLQQYPARPTLAVEYFRVSPLIYGRLSPAACGLWGQLGQELTRLDASFGQAFFVLSRTFCEQATDVDPIPAWEMARHLLRSAPKLALSYLERYPHLVQRFGAETVTQIHAILLALPMSTATTEPFLRVVSGTLGLLPASDRVQVLRWCQRIAAVSAAGMLDFLRHVPELSRCLPGQRLEPWITTGLAIAQRHAEAGQAYFALESVTAYDALRTLQTPVAFADVERILQLYTEGLHGQRLLLKTTAALPSMPGATPRELPTTNGNTIFVPEQVETFPEARENFAVYKVTILHQVGFYECGTFTFAMDELLRYAPDMAQRLARLDGPPGDTTAAAFEQFFARFPQPALACQLFTMLEDARIDAHLSRCYKGIRQDLARLMQHSLQQRPALQTLSLRQALLEGLLQLTLGSTPAPTLPAIVRQLLQLLARRLQRLLTATTTVYDTAVAVVDCYRLITEIPLLASAMFSAAAVADLAAQFSEEADGIDLAELFRQAGEGTDSLPTLPESTEPAQGVEPVPYRGEIKPELIQKQLRLQDLTNELDRLQDALSPMPPEVLKQLLEQGNIDIKSLQAGELSATSGLFVSELEGKDGVQSATNARQVELQQEIAALRVELDTAYGELSAPGQTLLYDEWDYNIGDYRKRWCRLSETVLPEDDTAFVDETRQKYAELLMLVSRQFQFLKPEMFKKIKRLADGEDIDLDSAIEAIVDRHAGNALTDDVYVRRNKRDRSVAALFLLDMSASTDDEVKEPAKPDATLAAKSQPPRLFDFSGFIQDDHYAHLSPRTKSEKPRRRIIDVEKEALVLMAEALDALGDAYAVYGFSGYGRDQVDFFVAKEFTDRYDARVQGRIAAIKPHRSTRMGTAIRHAIWKLERQEARLKTLLLLSDGYPQDYDYGKDRKSKDYGIQDTMMALHEAQLKGIQTFCITVDPAGHDYLRQMCPDANYLVLEDITALPNELPKIYRGLTT